MLDRPGTTAAALAAVRGQRFAAMNVGWGSTPEVGTGRAPTPASSSGQRAFTAIAVKRVGGEVLTPIGILAAGRMGAHWGLGTDSTPRPNLRFLASLGRSRQIVQ